MHLLCFEKIFTDAEKTIEALNHFFEFSIFLGEIAESILIGNNFSIAEQRLEFVESIFHLFQFCTDGLFHCIILSGLLRARRPGPIDIIPGSVAIDRRGLRHWPSSSARWVNE